MNKTFIAFLCTALLLAMGIEGLATSRRGRCICQVKSPNPVPVKHLAELEDHPRSPSCDQDELVAILKHSKERRCLDPKSERVKKMVEKYKKELRRKLSRERRRKMTGDLSPQ